MVLKHLNCSEHSVFGTVNLLTRKDPLILLISLLPLNEKYSRFGHSVQIKGPSTPRESFLFCLSIVVSCLKVIVVLGF